MGDCSRLNRHRLLEAVGEDLRWRQSWRSHITLRTFAQLVVERVTVSGSEETAEA
jgi:hypothetical protein